MNEYWKTIDPEQGFTSDVITDPDRFVGRATLLSDCIKAINSKLGLIAIYGKRGVGKSSLLRQIQQMALGDYTLAEKTGLKDQIPERPRKYLTVYYQCDSMIESSKELLSRLCNDQDEEDGLLRLVPNEGKEEVEFSRTSENHGHIDLKVLQWGAKGIGSSRYARIVEGDIVQTFRNFIASVVSHQVHKRMGRDGLLILLDEFDVLSNKEGIGSLIKSLSSESLKFGICGIADDLSSLVEDHASVGRLLEEGALHVEPMPDEESRSIISTAEQRYKGRVEFDEEVEQEIVKLSQGYPYLTQLFGKECINACNRLKTGHINNEVLQAVKMDVKSGRAFPTLEADYQRAIGDSTNRQMLLHLLAEQQGDATFYGQEMGRVSLKESRPDAKDFDVDHVDQLIPRLIEKRFGPVLRRSGEKQGIYEFVNPVFRVYVTLRTLD